MSLSLKGKTALALISILAAAPVCAQPYESTQQDPYLVIQGQEPASSVNNMPSYQLTAPPAVTAPSQPAYRQIGAAPQVAHTLDTRSGIQLGLQESYYDYREPSFGPHLEGAKTGFDGIGDLTIGEGYFLTADLRDALGNSRYKGSGTASNQFENLLDVRGLIGRDFNFTDFSLSPYGGFGYRQLYSDDNGRTSTGAGLYRRTNDLYYLPLGVTPRLKIDNDSRLSATLEYDVFLHSTQESDLGDVNPRYPTLNNSQDSGYGLRGNVMYETGNWSLGPFVTYWNVDQSNSACASTAFYTACGVEPANKTLEAGFQVFYRIL